MMAKYKENIIREKSFRFSVRIVKLCKLMRMQKEYVLSKQVLRSGTSIGANVEEAMAARTKKDFAYKMAVASKEARETRYWLKLLSASKIIHYDLTSIEADCNDIISILTAIVKTTQLRLANQKKAV